MKELGEAINESVADSDQIAEVIARIKAGGYDVFLVLEATIGFNQRDEEAARRSPGQRPAVARAELDITSQDLKFLRSLRISVERRRRSRAPGGPSLCTDIGVLRFDFACGLACATEAQSALQLASSLEPLSGNIAFGKSPAMRDTLGVLLAGGAGERLYPLTRDRAKPAVTFGGIYRIIDITLSNCINSDLRRVYILTQYKALSLNRHIREGWGNIVGRELGEFIEILPPMKRVSENWYMGTADAVYQNIYSIGSEQPKHVLILSGDHIYKMNYDLMLRQHKDSGADVTLATILIDPAETQHFGVVEIDRTGRVTGFQEKPEQTDLRSPYNPRMVSASMGIYMFNTDVLIPVLLKDAEDPTSRHDFGHNILPRMVDDYKVYSFNFIDENKKEALYWRDVGTLDAYYEANMDLVSVAPVFNLYDKAWPIRTHHAAVSAGQVRV